MKEKIKSFIQENKGKLLLVFTIYLIVSCAIASANYPYIDDAIRQVNGSTGFSASYARYFSEYASWLVQGDKHLTDLGWSTHILSGLIMSLVSIIMLYLVTDGKQVTWLSAIGSVFLGINPWFLEVLSFRFDSPYISFSVLLVVFPFIFARFHNLIFALTSIVGTFLMCNAYQASSGIYLIVLLTIVFLGWLRMTGKKFIVFSDNLIVLLTGILSYIVGILLYLVEIGSNPQLEARGNRTVMAEMADLPEAMLTNLKAYYDLYVDNSSPLWLQLGAILVLMAVLSLVLESTINKFVALILALIYVALASLVSIGIYAALADTVIDDRLRYAYGFAFVFGIILIFAAFSTKRTWLYYAKASLVPVFMYYILSFSLAYASILSYQQTTFELYTGMLAEDLSHIPLDNIQKDEQERTVIFTNKMLKNSLIYENTVKNYKILELLVPSNETVYRPNSSRFNNIADTNLSFVKSDYIGVDFTQLQLRESNTYYDIYSSETNIFINMK